MNPYYRQVCDYIDAHRDEMLEVWKTSVNLEGHYKEKENVKKAQDYFRTLFEEAGFVCAYHDIAGDRCGVLTGVLGEERPGKPVLFSGHVDTVHLTGSFGKENPFEIRDGKAYGPGVLDMKGGIVMALYIIKALNAIGWKERPIRILFAGDEEGDHAGNDVDRFIRENAAGALCAFNMETGHIENRLCVGRKTQYTLRAKVHGLGGHSGNEFTKGRNAVHEAILKCAELIKLTNLDEGTTLTVSVITSGGNTNSTSIPELSEFTADIRVFTHEIGKKVVEQIDRIMHTTFIEGTTTEYQIEYTKLHPFDQTPESKLLLEKINAVASENGFPEFGEIRLGGASDAGAISQAGVPVICSCGPKGEFNHNIKEYAIVESLFERAKIFALTVTELGDFDRQLSE